jgi:hypothetical protein
VAGCTSWICIEPCVWHQIQVSSRFLTRSDGCHSRRERSRMSERVNGTKSKSPHGPVQSALECTALERYSSGTQPIPQLRPALSARHGTNRNGHGLAHTDEHDQPLAPGDAGVQQVSLQHGVMLGHDRDDDGKIFRALALVDRRRVGRHERFKSRRIQILPLGSSMGVTKRYVSHSRNSRNIPGGRSASARWHGSSTHKARRLQLRQPP